jgi:hypothetical protein
MWKKYILFALGFIFITAPGAVADWLSLIDRTKSGEHMSISILNWQTIYNTIFPILGLGVLLFGIWWTRPKKEACTFYENRGSLPPLLDDFAQAEEVWVSWRVATSAKMLSRDIWNNTHFTRLLIHHPNPTKDEPDYLKAHVLGFPNRNIDEFRTDIYSATRQAPKHIDVRWFNGYLGDSLLIFNPKSARQKGWIRIEITTASSQANDRPSIRVNEKQYPKLFKNLVDNYESTFKKGEKPSDNYRQLTKLSIVDKEESQTG